MIPLGSVAIWKMVVIGSVVIEAVFCCGVLGIQQNADRIFQLFKRAAETLSPGASL